MGKIPRRGALCGTALFSSLLLLGAGCASHVPFTQSLRTTAAPTEDELKHAQFWSSFRLVLERDLSSNPAEIAASHEVVSRGGKRIERVVLENETPGIAVTVNDDSLEISFEKGTSFTFTPTNPSPRDSDGYVHNGWYCAKSNGTVRYAGNDYKVVSDTACLMVKDDLGEESDHKLKGLKTE